jgi:hypothetical protein
MTSFQHLPGRDRLLCRAPPDLVPVIASRDDFLALMKPQWLVVKDIMYVIYMNSLHFYEVPPGSAGALSFRLTQPVLGPSPESTSKHRRSPFSSSLAVWTLIDCQSRKKRENSEKLFEIKNDTKSTFSGFTD